MPKCMQLGFNAWVGVTAIIAVPINAQAALISLNDKAIPQGNASTTIYSAGLEAPKLSLPPSDHVESGTTSVAFSRWRMPVSQPRYPDISLGPLLNPLAGGTYNASTGAYSRQWLDNHSITLGGGGYVRTGAGTADNAFAGIATVVSLPVAVWLLGAGLLGMVAVARRNNQSDFFRPLT